VIIKMEKFLKGWTLFEKLWLLVFTAVNIYLFIALDDSLIGFVSSLSGMICVVLVAKGKISNYYFGIVQTVTYTYIAYTYGLYGESMLNGLFYLPIQFIGIYMWSRNRVDNSVKGEDVAVNRLTNKGWVYLIAITVVTSSIYAYILNAIGGQQVRLDSVAVVLSIIAQFLMLKRYAEQWVLWIVVNVLSVTMWFIVLASKGGNDYAMLVMWSAFLVNSVYGYVNWIRMGKKQNSI
jgi:nicotinamide mononucleotide transporter